MQFCVVGINHKTAPLALREKAAIGAERLPGSLELLRSFVPQGVILSTCNRTEIYTATEGCDAEKAVLAFLSARMEGAGEDLPRYIYTSQGEEAMSHLFRVASGLESMVLGEYEILGQVKLALEAAEKAGMLNLPLRHIFHSAIRTSRRAREETGISRHALSVSSVAVDLAAGILGDLRKCKMLVIGAGEAGQLVARVARERGTPDIVIASRTSERATALASAVQGRPTDLGHLAEEMDTVDVAVTCAGAPHRIVDAAHVQEAMKSRPERPLVIIDIAIPRNVEPEVGDIPGVFLYNLDNLRKIANSNRRQRRGEMRKAEDIVRGEVSELVSWWGGLEARPMVSELMNKAEEIRSAQLNKTLKKLPPLSDEQRDSLEAMTKSIVTKILKDPVEYMKSLGHNHPQREVISQIFQLEPEKHP